MCNLTRFLTWFSSKPDLKVVMKLVLNALDSITSHKPKTAHISFDKKMLKYDALKEAFCLIYNHKVDG